MSLPTIRAESYARLLRNLLVREGMPEDEPRPDVWVMGQTVRDMALGDRYRVWTYESMHYAFGEIQREATCWRTVVRCLCQANKYAPQATILHPNAYDALNELSSMVQDKIGAIR